MGITIFIFTKITFPFSPYIFDREKSVSGDGAEELRKSVELICRNTTRICYPHGEANCMFLMVCGFYTPVS